MLLHIRPKLFSHCDAVELVDLEIEPLGLFLRAKRELATRRPYPNKRYAVGCRREGRKALDGILIETATRKIDDLYYKARWAIEGELLATHRVHYKLLDHEFDAASDNMVLWGAMVAEGEWSAGLPPTWSDRWPAWAAGLPPTKAEPLMEIVLRDDGKNGRAENILDARGQIVERREVFAMPTIERERIITGRMRDWRVPSVSSAFTCG
jgi:hypothetical protein